VILKVFSVYDSKVEAFLPPLFMKSKGEFLRAFTEACSERSSMFSKHPADYTAFEVGSWDDSSCTFTLLATPVSLGLALDFVKESTKSVGLPDPAK